MHSRYRHHGIGLRIYHVYLRFLRIIEATGRQCGQQRAMLDRLGATMHPPSQQHSWPQACSLRAHPPCPCPPSPPHTASGTPPPQCRSPGCSWCLHCPTTLSAPGAMGPVPFPSSAWHCWHCWQRRRCLCCDAHVHSAVALARLMTKLYVSVRGVRDAKSCLAMHCMSYVCRTCQCSLVMQSDRHES